MWGRPATIASAITAARSAGWNVPFYTPPTGADPFVRQQLADHPSWVDGLTFAAGRLTAEVGAGPFTGFTQRYVAAYGVDRVGVHTSAGAAVIEPPETPMYAYDFVNLLAAALTKAGSTDPAKVTKALEEVTVEGANGDERAFNHSSHEGVVDDDVYFARFHDMTYAPRERRPALRNAPDDPADAVTAARRRLPSRRSRARARRTPLSASPSRRRSLRCRHSRRSPAVRIDPRRTSRTPSRRRRTSSVAIDRSGTPFAVTATQRLDVRGVGDYFFTIGAPVLARPGARRTPRRFRACGPGPILWAGFNPGERLLVARATLGAGAGSPGAASPGSRQR